MESIEFYLLVVLIVLVCINLLMLFLKNGNSNLQDLKSSFLENSNRVDHLIRGEFKMNRDENARSLKDSQELLRNQLNTYGQNQNQLLSTFQKQIQGLTESNKIDFKNLREGMTKSVSDMRFEVSRKMEIMRKDNSDQLDKMRETVDEKLQKTLEDRLGKSFELVSKRLEEVQKGLGEMQALANGVGDLKRVLTNVKTRGTMGEIQLGNILEQLLTPDQYALNVATIPGSSAHVEFAIKLPGRDSDNSTVWLPIDSKFPMDKYDQLQLAYESAEKQAIEVARKALSNTIKSMAKEIKEKYISPPHTTDFAVLFLPVEGLFAEVLRDVDLNDQLQREFKIMIAGPTNLAALLNSLQMGFRSLAIEKRSSEVWKILGAVKTEFGKFGGVLDKVQKKLGEASNTIDKLGVRTRAIDRNLRTVEALPSGDQKSLPFDDGIDIEDFALNDDLEIE